MKSTRTTLKAGAVTLAVVLLVGCGNVAVSEKARTEIQAAELNRVLEGTAVTLPQSATDCELVADNIVGSEVPIQVQPETTTERMFAILQVNKVRYINEQQICLGQAVIDGLNQRPVMFTAVASGRNKALCYVSDAAKERLGEQVAHPWVAAACGHLWDDRTDDIVEKEKDNYEN